MKFTAKAEDLAAFAETLAQGALPKDTIPIVANVAIVVSERVTGWTQNFEQEVFATLDANISSKGAVCVSAEVLKGFTKRLPKGSLVEGEGDGKSLTLQCGRARASLGSLDYKDLPRFTEGKFPHSFTLPTEALLSLIGKTAWAVSTEQTRYYLCGLCVAIEDRELIAVATDGRVLARSGVPAPLGAANIPTLLVPAPALAMIAAAAKSYRDGILIECGDTRLRATIGRVAITTKLIDGTFPDYRMFIPRRSDAPVKVLAKELLAAIDRVSSLSDKTMSRAVKLVAHNGSLTITGKSDHGECEETIDAVVNGHAVEFGFIPAQLTSEILATGAEEIALHIGEPSAAATVVGVGPGNGDFFVLMPYRI